MTELRVDFLKQFDNYVREMVTNESYFEYWLQTGIPDGADDDILTEIAEDNELWFDVVNAFAYVVESYVAKYGKESA